jgi:hypothetical protein
MKISVALAGVAATLLAVACSETDEGRRDDQATADALVEDMITVTIHGLPKTVKQGEVVLVTVAARAAEGRVAKVRTLTVDGNDIPPNKAQPTYALAPWGDQREYDEKSFSINTAGMSPGTHAVVARASCGVLDPFFDSLVLRGNKTASSTLTVEAPRPKPKEEKQDSSHTHNDDCGGGK